MKTIGKNNIQAGINYKIGYVLYRLIEELYPLCRSITGNGVRKTLSIIKRIIPIDIKEIASGTRVYDWVIPKEWNIRDAYIKNSKGEKIIDFRKSNLHVLNYSVPKSKKMTFDEIKDHLFTLPDHPDWIPYLTSYYQENWGFCITHNQLMEMHEDTFEVFIDSELIDGSLTYGEYYIRGELKDEVLLSCYVCHPSLCNDNLTGIALISELAKYVRSKKNRYSYRFLFIPETIGAIAWLKINEKNVSRIKHGLVATCLGDPGQSTYKKTRKGNCEIDKAVEKVLIDSVQPYKIMEYFPSGSDERQYCSPGFDLPVGSLMRTPYGMFPEYHTSADNLDFIKPKYLEDSFIKYMKVINIIENNAIYFNFNPKCEPQLSKRGLYGTIGAKKTEKINELALFWILNLSDGTNSLLDIAIRSKIDFETIKLVANILEKNGLIGLKRRKE